LFDRVATVASVATRTKRSLQMKMIRITMQS
jgi:hypothetical protein